MRVIGIGARHRGDDAAGLMVADGLGAFHHDGEPASLIEAWNGVDEVVLVDAIRSGRSVGEVVEFDAIAEPLPLGVCRSTHALGLASAIELARALERLPRRLRVIGIEGAEFGFGADPSPEVVSAVERVVRRLADA